MALRLTPAQFAALRPIERAPVAANAPRGPNKTEAAWRARELDARLADGELVAVDYEAVRLTLAARCTYTADYAAWRADGRLELHEVKGPHVYEDARIKFKVAVSRFPAIGFVWAQRTASGVWAVQRFNVPG